MKLSSKLHCKDKNMSFYIYNIFIYIYTHTYSYIHIIFIGLHCKNFQGMRGETLRGHVFPELTSVHEYEYDQTTMTSD